ncbi:hypothetical protein PRIPAC_75544 [Pristionchus pacificus]|uniref:Uncharacterized protein n=1 Tax=Pristionchus pacificus TaxID=54126 RepID=A0A2A6CRE9_PRIPA|nr:hypothetical protein PRIPAC_75544 [Pristionchus pacificus]|eukprot:PDM80719.1 hypothetical protein PRIPAC_35722 [Pristionchus pacificus]
MIIILLAIFVSFASSDTSILIQRACTINPKLEICRTSIKRSHSKFGSLLTLPTHSGITQKAEEKKMNTISAMNENVMNVTDILLSSESQESINSSVSVFISEYCVDERNRFVQKCHGEVDPSEEEFCKSYPSSCSTVGDVIPIMTYCARHYKQYRPLCSNDETDLKAEQFCLAFEQFCLPLNKQSKHQTTKPSPVLQRCEDVVKEARKVCNPMPTESDEFNFIRCNRFVERCRKYVDWI